MHSRERVAEPTQSKNIPPKLRPLQKTVFEWYENRVEEGLAKLYRQDLSQRQRVMETIRELEDSNLFWSLLTKWGDAYHDAKDDSQKHEIMMGLLARIYIAGSLRGEEGIDL